jgi:hypothetical protein
MSKRPLLFDFRNVEVPRISVWEIVTLPIRMLGRVAVDSMPEATARPAARDLAVETKPDSRSSGS